MSITHNDTMQNFLCDTWRTKFANGTLKLFDNNDTLLVTINLGATPFNASVNGAATLVGALQGTATAIGTITSFELADSGGTFKTTGTVGLTNASDLQISNRDVVVNSVVSVSTLTLTQPATVA